MTGKRGVDRREKTVHDRKPTNVKIVGQRHCLVRGKPFHAGLM